MKNQSKKQVLKSIPKHAIRFVKVYNSSIRDAREINAYLQYKNQKKESRDALKREINAYLQNKKQIKINNELKKLRLGKLINNNISERNLINIKELNAFPIKTLHQIAKLRNINSNMSKSNTIYALIQSEPVINEKKYIFDSNSEIRKKINDIRTRFFDVSPYLNKKARGNIRIRLYDIGKMTKFDRNMKKYVARRTR